MAKSPGTPRSTSTRSSEAGLQEMAAFAGGRPMFGLAVAGDDVLVLVSPGAPLRSDLRELTTAERVHLAALPMDQPVLVVENEAGDFVVLADQPLDLEQHVPLGPADAEVLSRRDALVRFGRRDDDVLVLAPWTAEDEVVLFDPEAEDFAAVPLVRLGDDGVVVERGEVPAALRERLQGELERLAGGPDERFGVLSNPFGEHLCVPEGGPLLPHEDLRRQTLLGTAGLLDGMASLEEAVAALRALAARLEDAAEDGWELTYPVSGDLVPLERRD